MNGRGLASSKRSWSLPDWFVPEVLHVEEWFDVARRRDAWSPDESTAWIAAADGRVVITDYKTGKPRSQEDADESLQLSIYALAAREKWGYQVDRLAFYNLDGNSSMVTLRSDLQLSSGLKKVESVAERIAPGDFRAKPGFHCSFCAYRNSVPGNRKKNRVIRATDSADFTIRK